MSDHPINAALNLGGSMLVGGAVTLLGMAGTSPKIQRVMSAVWLIAGFILWYFSHI